MTTFFTELTLFFTLCRYIGTLIYGTQKVILPQSASLVFLLDAEDFLLQCNSTTLYYTKKWIFQFIHSTRFLPRISVLNKVSVRWAWVSVEALIFPLNDNLEQIQLSWGRALYEALWSVQRSLVNSREVVQFWKVWMKKNKITTSCNDRSVFTSPGWASRPLLQAMHITIRTVYSGGCILSIPLPWPGLIKNVYFLRREEGCCQIFFLSVS